MFSAKEIFILGATEAVHEEIVIAEQNVSGTEGHSVFQHRVPEEEFNFVSNYQIVLVFLLSLPLFYHSFFITLSFLLLGLQSYVHDI